MTFSATFSATFLGLGLLASSLVTAAHANKWQGLYVGAVASLDNLDYTASATDNLSALGTTLQDNAFGGNLYAGYNIPLGNILLGIEGDIGYNGTEVGVGVLTGGDILSLNVENRFNAGVRGRIGIIFGDALLYGTGGVTWSNLSLDLKTTLGGTSTSLNKTENVMGYSIGGGAEFMLLNSLILRAEYLYSDFGELDFSTLDGTGSFDSASHDFRIGVALKF